MGFGGVKIEFNKQAIKEKIVNAEQMGKAVIMEQVLTDSNYFCREDTGALISSSIASSRPADGVLVWDTPYAKRVYYIGNPSKDVNPNASLTWFLKAKAKFGKDWVKTAQKLMNKNLSKQPDVANNNNGGGG